MAYNEGEGWNTQLWEATYENRSECTRGNQEQRRPEEAIFEASTNRTGYDQGTDRDPHVESLSVNTDSKDI